MLRIVGQALAELGLISPGASLSYHINITTGDAMSISAFADDRRFLQVKASEFVDLGALYQIYGRAWSDHPALVPRPLGHLDRDGWSIMVCEGVLHTTVPRADVIRHGWRGSARVSEQMYEYFRGARGLEASAAALGQKALVRDLLHHFQDGPLSRLASAVVANARAVGVESMPVRPQHGDFVLNNLGRVGKQLVVFDWEDYGKVSLPGLDIFTLYLSLVDGDVVTLRRLMHASHGSDGKAETFICRACSAQGLEWTLFCRLVPLYLLVFLYLKRNYGTRIQDRIRALLSTLIAANDAPARFDSAQHIAGPSEAHASRSAP